MNYLALSLTSMLLGFVHGFDTDHVIDVTDFVSQDPRPLHAALFGARFGIGHTTTVLTVGLLVYTLKSVVPGLLENTFQLLSGVVLIALGVWGIHRRLIRRRTVSKHHHIHGAPGDFTAERTSVDNTVFRYGPIVTGMMTGMVGTAGVMLLGPVAAAPSAWWVVFFILLYGLGVIGAMCGYGFVASSFFRSGFFIGRRGSMVSKIVPVIPSVLSIALGSMWFFRIAVGLKNVLGAGL
ncbi:hypothetical protein SY88_14295 [Clostridiales bacterium PH28_bin88]|nr:hypothetical protein SY88_14295 [Clostridiales bacterium PH28_bin88]